jgi:hypothetical protein
MRLRRSVVMKENDMIVCWMGRECVLRKLLIRKIYNPQWAAVWPAVKAGHGPHKQQRLLFLAGDKGARRHPTYRM